MLHALGDWVQVKTFVTAIMKTYAPIVDEDNMEKQNKFVEVVDAEKQLWALIHSKELLRIDVQDLYRKARSGYEDMILNDHEVMELQDVEYCLWKLHYKHIDEFRKRIRQFSGSAENKKSGTPQDVASVQNSIDDHMEGFKSFLSEASEFYKDLIRKIKKSCGLHEELLLDNKDDSSFMVEPTKFLKCQYTCHRLLVCLGDLARYRELCQKSDNRNCKWSVAASYYFEAAIICPHSGNPQNQLALLATYVGDDFLALYHCVRSLAIKEPFPDAWDNLMLLFEKNRSYPLHSLSSEVHFDLLKPSERSCSRTKSYAPNGSSNNKKLEATEHVSSGVTDLWPLLVRMTSFFFVKSSSEDFHCAFSSMMRRLEALLEFSEIELKASLESYDCMDSSRRGPYRSLQLVSILIFIIHNLTESPEVKNPIEKNEMEQSDVGQLVWIATFICMGRLLERCMEGSHLDSCPLLVAVLVFVEWLVGMLDKAETYGAHEKVGSATSYFFGVFCNLLNRLDNKEGEVKFLDHTALWEDYELRGFSPLAHAHMPLDFSAHREHMGNCENRYVSRAHRILHAAMQIVERSRDSWKWISYDKLGRKYYAEDPIKITCQREAELMESSSDTEVKDKNLFEKETSTENQVHHHGKDESAVAEEEEVILFKPITRHNSEPIYASNATKDPTSPEDNNDQTVPSDDILRRATSLFVPQNQAQLDSSNFHPDTTNFRFNKPYKQQEPLLKDSASYPVGPPSLSGWVLNRESIHVEREKGQRDFHRNELSPIEEIPSAFLAGLSINEKDVSATTHNSSPPYVAPLPSAPQLPADAIWFRAHSSSFPESKTGVGIREAEGILGASPVSGYSPTHGPFSPRLPGFIDGYPPLLGLSSSEWLYQYRNNHNLEQAYGHPWPVQFNTPGEFGNFHRHDASRFDLFDRWGNPLASNQMVYLDNPQLHQGSSVYGADEQRREKHFLGYQRPSPYGCGVGTDLRAEQPPLLQYLQDREWQLHRESQMRGPTYMGN